MLGTLINIITVIIGSSAGILLGNRLPERIQQSVVMGLGLITLVVGIQNAFVSGNIIIPLLATVLGVIVGELLRIDALLEGLAAALQARFSGDDTSDSDDSRANRERFITGFVTASLVFCVGPLTVVGSLQDGMGLAVGFQALLIKSVLDMFSSMAFAASFGVGVLMSVLTIFVVQGGLALTGMLLVNTLADSGALASNPMILEMTAAGGILLIGLSLVLMDIKQPRMANFLPALALAPLLVWLASLLGIPIYPL